MAGPLAELAHHKTLLLQVLGVGLVLEPTLAADWAEEQVRELDWMAGQALEAGPDLETGQALEQGLGLAMEQVLEMEQAAMELETEMA
jgi:hypothetical protein